MNEIVVQIRDATGGNTLITQNMLKKIKHQLYRKYHPDTSNEDDGYMFIKVKDLVKLPRRFDGDCVVYWTEVMEFRTTDTDEDTD